jgi:hypothetical protein
MLLCSKCIKDMIESAEPGLIPLTGKHFSNCKKTMKVEVLNLATANFNFQSILMSKSILAQGRVLWKVKAEEKESKNFFAVIRAEEKEKSTHHSLHKSRQKLSAVALGEK